MFGDCAFTGRLNFMQPIRDQCSLQAESVGDICSSLSLDKILKMSVYEDGETGSALVPVQIENVKKYYYNSENNAEMVLS